MTINAIQFKGFNKKCPYARYFLELKDNNYIFIIRWVDYCDCAFLTITDYNDIPIISSKALVNNLKIRTHELPYELYFMQINEETYEPTLDNIENEFALFYDDEDEIE